MVGSLLGYHFFHIVIMGFPSFLTGLFAIPITSWTGMAHPNVYDAEGDEDSFMAGAFPRTARFIVCAIIGLMVSNFMITSKWALLDADSMRGYNIPIFSSYFSCQFKLL